MFLLRLYLIIDVSQEKRRSFYNIDPPRAVVMFLSFSFSRREKQNRLGVWYMKINVEKHLPSIYKKEV